MKSAVALMGGGVPGSSDLASLKPAPQLRPVQIAPDEHDAGPADPRQPPMGQ